MVVVWWIVYLIFFSIVYFCKELERFFLTTRGLSERQYKEKVRWIDDSTKHSKYIARSMI